MPTLLQIDDPQLASHWAMHPSTRPMPQMGGRERRALEHAPRHSGERIRYHTCYSINMGRASTQN
jgi:hypothetical protein